MISSTVLFRLILTFCAVLVAYKILTPLLIQLMQHLSDQKKNKKHDFEQMVNKYKREMGQQSLAVAGGNNVPQKEKNTCKTETKYQKRKEELEKNKENSSREYKEICTILAIIKNISWGSGEEFEQLSTTIAKDAIFPISSNDIIRSFKSIVDNDILILFKDDFSLDLIKKIIHARLTIDELIRETLSNPPRGVLMNDICLEQHMQSLIVAKAVVSLIFKANGKKQEAVLDQLFQPSFAPDSALNEISNQMIETAKWQMARENKSINIRTPQQIISMLIEEAEMIDYLHPPLISISKDKDPVGWAYQTLNCHKEDGLKKIKKAYKKLAKRKHPDVQKKFKLPGKYQDLIHNNFLVIQQAYDILKEQQNLR